MWKKLCHPIDLSVICQKDKIVYIFRCFYYTCIAKICQYLPGVFTKKLLVDLNIKYGHALFGLKNHSNNDGMAYFL